MSQLFQEIANCLLITNKLIEMAKTERKDFVYGSKYAAWLRRIEYVFHQGKMNDVEDSGGGGNEKLSVVNETPEHLRNLPADSPLLFPVRLNSDLFTNIVR